MLLQPEVKINEQSRQSRIPLPHRLQLQGKKQLYVLVQKLCGSFEASEGSLICRELLGLEKGEDLEEPAVRTEAYYQSRPCVKACRRAAEILEEYVKEQKRK